MSITSQPRKGVVEFIQWNQSNYQRLIIFDKAQMAMSKMASFCWMQVFNVDPDGAHFC